MGTGHAAGLAASVAVKEKILPRDIEGERVRAMLLDEGMDLDKPCEGYWQEMRDTEGDMVIGKADAIVLVPKEK